MYSVGELDEFIAIPRVTALRLAPDGSWIAAAVQTVAGEPPKYVTSLWRIGTTPGTPPVRLTRSAEGEGGPEFLPDGSVLFVSKRPDPAAGKQDAEAEKDKAAVWLLPAGGGEPRRIAAAGGGIGGVATARHADTIVYAAPAFAGTDGAEADAARRKARKEAGVSAILHDSGQTGRLRYWDHDLGPDELRLFGAPVQADTLPADTVPAESGDGSPQPRDLTPNPGRALDEQHYELTPDGLAVVTGWSVPDAGSGWRGEVAVIDTGTGSLRVLLAGEGLDFENPRVSPDGGLVVAIRSEHASYDEPGDATLVLTALADGAEPRDLLAGFDRRPVSVAWAADSAAVYFTADDGGRCPVFRVDLAGGDPVRLTFDNGAYDSLCPAPDGSALFALRSAIDEPPTPVLIDLAEPGDPPVRLSSPGTPVQLPGSLTEVACTAADGTTIRGWLVLPAGASAAAPAPLLLWVHGGPVASWNTWSWRWSPWLMAARGYAVLLPDPALSTGYGHHMIVRGHGQWGGNPYTDVMSITDEVVARPDIDAARTAMMGGSYGGYMANWIAGHTGRFRAIVSHAGLWHLDQMFGTTDAPPFWRRHWGDPITRPERYLANSPHLHADKISTPMLIIHGDKDYRVPLGEAVRLWWDLQAMGKPARFLYFPDENHWIMKPGDVGVWYQTVFSFLAEHVLGKDWQRPELL
jgi:dipeptidyl aminopeptidase/acylaminoacyl peptidase